MDIIRDYVRTALNGVRQRFIKLEKDFDKKLDDKLGRDELPPPQPQIQSDWNESNEESTAYIHNRPFYDDMVVKTYTYENAGTSGQGALMMDADFKGNFIPGETYTVAVNGSAMNIVAITDKYGYVALYPDGDSISSRIYVNHVYGWLQAFTWWNPGSTVSITGPFRTLKQIDNKFLNAVTSINGETGDVTMNAETLGAVSSKVVTAGISLDGRTNVYTHFTRNWLGHGSDYNTGLIMGDVLIFDDVENNTDVFYVTYIPDKDKNSISGVQLEDIIIRGVANPTKTNDVTPKKYVDDKFNSELKKVNTRINSCIPVPATATVGQTIAVKSVDENGKPTAWEPMDFISENYGGNVDLTGVVRSVNGQTPDENGNVEIAVSGGGGMSSTASALLITILRNGVYSTDQSANITALEAALASGGSDGGSDIPDIPDVPVEPDEPVDSGETSDILYELAEATAFDGTNSITTDVTLYDEDRDYSVVMDVEFDVANIGKTIFECWQPSTNVGIQIGTKYTAATNKLLAFHNANYPGIANLTTSGVQAARIVAIRTANDNTLTISAFVNGTRVETVSNVGTRTYQSHTNTCVISKDFVGTINDLKIYNRALTSEEVEAYLA